jgi:hypothetical protein
MLNLDNFRSYQGLVALDMLLLRQRRYVQENGVNGR